MKIHHFVQYGCSLILLTFSTVSAWYEGSALLQNPQEWKYTAKITNWINGIPENHRDILQIDFFIYAAKFKPIFIYLMIISVLHIIFLTIIIVRQRMNKTSVQ
ncbi:YjdJ family protein [Metabacillus niabensis]|uniref:YjdJ family protein n=1 Tax=Metabacillus niabensis TaxID=324854 RepID=UPI0039A33045